MSFLTRLLGKDDAANEAISPDCTHASLVAHWDNPDDMGSEDLASSWKCASCGEEFTRDEYRRLQEVEGERLAQYQAEKAELEQRDETQPTL